MRKIYTDWYKFIKDLNTLLEEQAEEDFVEFEAIKYFNSLKKNNEK